MIEAVERLKVSADRMEIFGAIPDAPFDSCMQRVDDCNALIVIVGSRYGWIPSLAQGGDGERSITWHEVARAFDAGKPIFAFVMDRSEPNSERELNEATAASITQFEKYLAERVMYARFKTAEDLALEATASVANWLLGHFTSAPAITGFDRTAFALDTTEFAHTAFPLAFEYAGRDAPAVAGAVARSGELVVKLQAAEISSKQAEVWLTAENRGDSSTRWFGPIVTCYTGYLELRPDLRKDGSHLITDLYPGEQLTASLLPLHDAAS